jgi:hypothetical protein
LPHKKPFDPLAMLPSADAIRQRLNETLTLAERLRILLKTVEQLRLPANTVDDRSVTPNTPSEGGCADE